MLPFVIYHNSYHIHRSRSGTIVTYVGFHKPCRIHILSVYRTIVMHVLHSMPMCGLRQKVWSEIAQNGHFSWKLLSWIFYFILLGPCFFCRKQRNPGVDLWRLRVYAPRMKSKLEINKIECVCTYFYTMVYIGANLHAKNRHVCCPNRNTTYKLKSIKLYSINSTRWRSFIEWITSIPCHVQLVSILE
jgi:hypothetical protein